MKKLIKELSSYKEIMVTGGCLDIGVDIPDGKYKIKMAPSERYS